MSDTSYSIEIKQDSLDLFQRSILYRFEEAKEPIQAAMGERFFEIVRSNFGDFGVDRPVSWAPLSPAYATKVKREHATLFVTGALEGAIKSEANEDRAKVSITNDDVPYALAHQYGRPEANLPARPYFPVDTNGEILPFTQGEVLLAAQAETARLLEGGLL